MFMFMFILMFMFIFIPFYSFIHFCSLYSFYSFSTFFIHVRLFSLLLFSFISCIFMHHHFHFTFCAFLCIFMHCYAFYAWLCIFMHFFAFLCIFKDFLSRFTHSFKRFFETEKQNPQTLSFLKCMMNCGIIV